MGGSRKLLSTPKHAWRLQGVLPVYHYQVQDDSISVHIFVWNTGIPATSILSAASEQPRCCCSSRLVRHRSTLACGAFTVVASFSCHVLPVRRTLCHHAACRLRAR